MTTGKRGGHWRGSGRSAVSSAVVCVGLVIVAAVGLTGCSVKERIGVPPSIRLEEASQTQARLLEFYRNWRGVPYREGGMDRSGIDCSGFVGLLFSEQFGKRLPRTTSELAAYGKRVDGRDARAGDLVFFKTGWFTRHVGVSLDADRFMHASTSGGVMISRVAESYWRDNFWQYRRVL